LKLEGIKNLIAKVAPTVGAAIGGPFGGIAGKFIQETLGVDSEQAAYDLIKHDPNALLELKKTELEFTKFMRQADIDEKALENENTASARGLFSVNIWPQITLSGTFILGYFCILYLVMSGTILPPTDLRETMILLLGVLAAEVPRIMNFWFGSSLGSREKTERIARMS
jgi:hypothetical protein